MSEFLVLNEVGHGQDPKTPVDVSIYASREAIERHIEPWFVDEPHMLLTNSGHRKVLTAIDTRVHVIASPDGTDYSELVRQWLIYGLDAVVKARAHRRAETIGAIDFTSMSTDDLCRLSLLF